jgi:UDP-N-acetylglucosamine transferase subunit ALG13
MPTFVSVGNARQPFVRLTEAVSRIAARLPAPVVVQHGHTSFDCPVCEGRAFVEMDEFAGLMGRSRLIILHAGAGSILQALDAGKYPVVMPRRLAHGEHIDDHQLELAQAFAGRGLVELAMEPADLDPAVQRALARQGQSAIRWDERLSRLLAEELESHARDCAEGGHKIVTGS